MSERRPKFRVGQVVYCKTIARWVRISKLHDDGYVFVDHISSGELGGMTLTKYLRPLTPREIGPQ